MLLRVVEVPVLAFGRRRGRVLLLAVEAVEEVAHAGLRLVDAERRGIEAEAIHRIAVEDVGQRVRILQRRFVGVTSAADEPDAEVAEGIVRTTAVDELSRAPERQKVRGGDGLIEADLELNDLEPLETLEVFLKGLEVIDRIAAICVLDDLPEWFPVHREPPDDGLMSRLGQRKQICNSHLEPRYHGFGRESHRFE